MRTQPPQTAPATGAARVLVVAPRQADVPAGALAAHERAGEAVRVLELAAAGLAEPRLAACYDLVERLRAEFEACDPALVVAPGPWARDPELCAVGRAVAAALARGPRRRVRFFEAGPDGRAELSSEELAEQFALRARGSAAGAGEWAATAVISTWNKLKDLRANLDGIRAQTRPFDAVIVVDNASGDGTAAAVADEYPEVRLIVMPHSAYGACETFNIGFASVTTPLMAILDDDVVLPPEWLEKALERMRREPPTTAVVSTEVIEPGMPRAYIESPAMRRERYMSTFRGCASLARVAPLREAGFYDERLFIYGNERDLTCRLLNLGSRVLQYPDVRAFHKTPFGIKMGRRSLYYHARNAWLSQLKYAPAGDLLRLPWLVLTKVLLRGGEKETSGEVSDATGTIGIGKSLRQTPGAWQVLLKAGWSVLWNVPYCLKHRAPVRSPDFELPLK
jgi:GT2 family glycosyltransferase